MNFAEAWKAVVALLPKDESFCLDVQVWRHAGSGPEEIRVTWKLWLTVEKESIEAPTPEMVLQIARGIVARRGQPQPDVIAEIGHISGLSTQPAPPPDHDTTTPAPAQAGEEMPL